jgi:hypothetical protein
MTEVASLNHGNMTARAKPIVLIRVAGLLTEFLQLFRPGGAGSTGQIALHPSLQLNGAPRRWEPGEALAQATRHGPQRRQKRFIRRASNQ